MRTRDNLIRALLLGFPLVLLYYSLAAWGWRYEAINPPFHVRIWNVPGGCIATDHYLLVDWPIASILLFAILTIASAVRVATFRVSDRKQISTDQASLAQKSTN
jgi:hypothetical protein